MTKKLFLILFSLTLFTNCFSHKASTDKVDIDKAIEIVCPGLAPVMILRTSEEEVRAALRKQFSHHKTRDTVLKLPDNSNVMIPVVRPSDLKFCSVREVPKVRIPASLGY